MVCSGLLLVVDNKSVDPKNVPVSLSTDDGVTPATTSSVIFGFPPEAFNLILQKIASAVKGKYKLITQIRDVKNPMTHRITLVDSELQSALWTLDQSIKRDEEDKYARIGATFREVTGKQLDPAQGQVYIRRRDRRFPLQLEGGGIQASIQLIFSVSNEIDKYSLFGIEEPEAHSHAELQRSLFGELKSLSEQCQIIITTHSPTFADRSNLDNVWISKFVDDETVVDKASELKEITEELGIKPSDILFFADQILFVEGKSEEIVLPAFAEKLGIDLTDVAILPVEGKGNARQNLKASLKITRGMLPIFLILDKDAEPEIETLRNDRLIESGTYHIWGDGSIESYYPIPLVEAALNEVNERYNLLMNVSDIMKKIKGKELTPDKIDLGEKRKLLDKTWEVILAESVARLLRTEKQVAISDELRRVLKDVAKSSAR